ncbi:MAG: SpoIIE family protein phosphatase [Bdellovibrionota bacterium]
MSGPDTQKAQVPIKYKFLGVLFSIMITCLSVFFFYAFQTFSEDKRMFIMDLNLSLLKAATAEVRNGIENRLEAVQSLIPRVYNRVEVSGKESDVYAGLPDTLPNEVLGVNFYRENQQGAFESIRAYNNKELLAKLSLPPNFSQVLDSRLPLPLALFKNKKSFELLNRSVSLDVGGKTVKTGVLTVLFSGKFIDRNSSGVVIVVDFVQDFIRNVLSKSGVAEVFLIRTDGKILGHSNLDTLVQYANQAFPHPVVARLKSATFPRESLELDVNGEDYLCNIGESGFPEVFFVSQVQKRQAFVALYHLASQSLMIMGILLCLSIIASIIFTNRLTVNITKLQSAAEEIGKGNLNLSLNVKSNDELQSVAESFEWMSSRLSDLIFETAKKALLEGELKNARLVQSTLLTIPRIATDDVEVDSHLVPATDLGGDFWDAYLTGRTLTIIIGDATGHGAPAALVTAIAKSCFSTLNTVYHAHPLEPEQVTAALNFILHSSCQGKLLMTMCIIQLNLDTGEIGICNAGHESPMVLRASSSSSDGTASDKGTRKAEILFARGERLGFSPEAEFKTVKFQLNPGDTLMLYTDGITEAKSRQGKEWGERQLRKVFSAGGTRLLSQIKQELVAAVGNHMGGAEQEDDITFVLIKWLGKHAQKAAPPLPKKVG